MSGSDVIEDASRYAFEMLGPLQGATAPAR